MRFVSRGIYPEEEWDCRNGTCVEKDRLRDRKERRRTGIPVYALQTATTLRNPLDREEEDVSDPKHLEV